MEYKDKTQGALWTHGKYPGIEYMDEIEYCKIIIRRTLVFQTLKAYGSMWICIRSLQHGTNNGLIVTARSPDNTGGFLIL